MTDDHAFESRLSAAFAAYVDRAPVDVDPGAVAVAVAALDGRTQDSELDGLRRRPRLLLVAALLALAALGSALAVGGGVPVHLRPDADAAITIEPDQVEPCALLEAAVARTTLEVSPFEPRRHSDAAWGGRQCATGWDDGYSAPHLLFLPARSTMDEARARLDSVAAGLAGQSFSGWTREQPGTWGGTWVDRGRSFSALAMFAEPYFFVVTFRDLDGAREIADAVLVELTERAGRVP